MPAPSDLFLSPDLSEDAAQEYLRALGFRDPAAVDDHLQRMAADPVVREALGRIAPDLLPALLESRDPDAAVAGLQQYVAGRTGPAMFVDYLREDPQALHVLTCLLGASPLLAGMLVRNPESFHWLVSQLDRSAPDRQDLQESIEMMLGHAVHPGEALGMLRRWKQRETLRIAATELLGRQEDQASRRQMADVASVTVDTVLSIVTERLLDGDDAPGAFAVVAAGDLGSGELSWSPGLDLIFLYDLGAGADRDTGRQLFQEIARALAEALADDSDEDCLYRVTLRGRPGGSRDIAISIDEAGTPSGALNPVPLAGDLALGRRFIELCRRVPDAGERRTG